jgi:hypothetical protein
MNKSRHARQAEITFNDVWQIRSNCVDVRELVEAVYEEYERWMRREPMLEVPGAPEPPEAVVMALRDVPLFTDLAAFSSDSAPGETVAVEEPFSLNLQDGYAIYLVNTHNFGFSGPLYSHAIVSLSESPVPDGSLVIALRAEQVYARRLLRSDRSPEVIALGSEAENPLDRPPSLLWSPAEVRLLRVVGIIFNDSPSYPKQNAEAMLLNGAGLLSNVQVVFKVRGESAVPLALPDQYILGGRVLTSDDVRSMEGKLVALATTDGSAFKRIGRVSSIAPHIRQFDSVGALGESLLARTEEVEDGFSEIPLLRSARQVLGVLYESF